MTRANQQVEEAEHLKKTQEPIKRNRQNEKTIHTENEARKLEKGRQNRKRERILCQKRSAKRI
jgi:hypothetical protein